MVALTGRVDAMESRLGNIEKMLQTILAISQKQATGNNKSPGAGRAAATKAFATRGFAGGAPAENGDDEEAEAEAEAEEEPQDDGEGEAEGEAEDNGEEREPEEDDY